MSAPSTTDENTEQRQQISVVYYNEQNEFTRAKIEIDENGKLYFNYDRKDIIHLSGVVSHFAIVWTVQIFFICFVVIADQYGYLVPPIIAILSYFVCYFAYWKVREEVFKFTIVIEILDAIFNLIFGCVLIFEALTTSQTNTRILEAYWSNQLALGIYLVISTLCQSLFVYVLVRAIKYGYTLYYWAPTEEDEILAFKVSICFVLFAVLAVIIALIVSKASGVDS